MDVSLCPEIDFVRMRHKSIGHQSCIEGRPNLHIHTCNNFRGNTPHLPKIVAYVANEDTHLNLLIIHRSNSRTQGGLPRALLSLRTFVFMWMSYSKDCYSDGVAKGRGEMEMG